MNTRINDRHRATCTDNQEIQAIRTALDTWDDTTDHHIINEDRIRDDLTALLEERSALLEAIEYWRRQANDTAFRCNELWAVLTQHKRERRLRGKTTTDPEELDHAAILPEAPTISPGVRPGSSKPRTGCERSRPRDSVCS